jgi:Family of unknown function (DUF5335)
MAIQRLEPREWVGFCTYTSRTLVGKQVEIEVASLQIGFQLQARRLPLVRMSYDPEKDVLELLVGELDHLIWAPRELYVDETPLGDVRMQIIDADGVRQLVTFSDPVMLPPPWAFR